MTQPKILIIEEESIIALELKLMLQSLGFTNTKILNSTKNLNDKIMNFKPDLIFSEIYFTNGIDIVKIIKVIKKALSFEVIFVTSLQFLANDAKIKSVAPLAVVGKPFQLNEIETVLKTKYTIGQIPES